MTSGPTWRASLLVLVLGAGIVAAGMVFIDRPVADFVHRTFAGTRLATCATWLLTLLPALLGSACLVALGAEVMRARGSVPGPWLRSLWLGLSGAALALLVGVALKLLIGRSDAAPEYVVYRTYGLHLFHGGRGYEAFPSATTAATSALVTVMSLRVPAARWAGRIGLAAVASAIIVTNGHWVTDVIAGACLGVFLGSVVVRAAARSA